MLALLLVTRNEADLLRLNLQHHLDWGIDHIAVADNRSTDATPDVLREFDGPVHSRVFDDFHVRQTHRHQMLAELQALTGGGIEWAGISDTDEFFWSPRPLRELLAEVPDDVVAVNFDAKQFVPTALDRDDGPLPARREYRVADVDSPLYTSYTEGKTFYRASWLGALPVDHNCAAHEHECVLLPQPRLRHEEMALHHYMVQDEDQFVDKVVRLINWAKPPKRRAERLRWYLTPAQRRPLPKWTSDWKKTWWRVYQEGGEAGVRDYYRTVYVIPQERVAEYLADGTLVHDDAFARHARERLVRP